MANTSLIPLKSNRLFAIPLYDSEHRHWNDKTDTLSYNWEGIGISGFSSQKRISVAVAQKYPTYEFERVQSIAGGIYQYSRLRPGDGILGLDGEKRINKIGYVSNDLRHDRQRVDMHVDWFDNIEPIKAEFNAMGDNAEIQKVTSSQLERLSLPPALFLETRRSIMSFGKEIGEEVLQEKILYAPNFPKIDPGGDVNLFYGTNRNKVDSSNVNDFYGDDLSDKLSLGICTVSIPRGHKQGELERPGKILWWQRNENANKDIVLTGIRELSGNTFYAMLKDAVDDSNNKAAFIFVHGFNTTFAEAAWRAGQITHDLRFSGLTGFFSWPSTGRELDYGRDIERADTTVPVFTQFVEDFVNNTGIEQLHFIGHSMGNRLLTRALNRLITKDSFKNKVKTISQIILAAPDIDKDLFNNDILPEFKSVGNRRTLYASDRDEALKLSRRLRTGLIRIGEAGERIYIAEGLDTVDASNVKSSGNHHSYMFETKELLNDIYLLLTQGLEPLNRRLREIQKEELKYWLFPQ